jgi:hypothetical protein
MSLNASYEFVFPNATFDETVYSQCTIRVKNNEERRRLVREKAEECANLLVFLPHLTNFSTFLTIEGKVYKLTLQK